ncbi:MAG TPA: 8-oxo-dGTP diphosphatase [Candidatus Edwardsbacteria bacterium]|nr:8-oxo-dGTP diphosphatase [Candidatus Edwardsbacteria bacterium]
MKLATLCYIKRDGRTLMMHRVTRPDDMHYGKWNGLGGKMHPGETPEECVIREVREESGLALANPELKGFITFPAFDEVEDWYVFVFVAREFAGSLIECDEGRLEWIDDAKLLELDLWEGDHVFMPWLNGTKLFSAKICYDKGRLSGHEVVFY